MQITLTILIILLAAFFKAVADTCADHYDTSIFKWWDRSFWDKTAASSLAPFIKGTKYRFDAWHLANSAMISSFIALCFVHIHYSKWYYGAGLYLIEGLFFITVFNFFYNKVLRK